MPAHGDRTVTARFVISSSRRARKWARQGGAHTQFIPLGFFSTALWMKAAAFQLVTQILATLAGGGLYEE